MRAIELSSVSPVYFFVQRINCLIKLNELGSAQLSARKLLKYYPNHHLGFEWLAKIAQKNKQWEDADIYWGKSIAEVPTVPLHYFRQKIHCLIQLGRLNEAEKIALNVLDKYPDKAFSYESLSKIARKKQQWKIALDYLNKGFEKLLVIPDSFYIGKVHNLISLKMFELAEITAKELIKRKIDSSLGYELYATIAQKNRKLDIALSRWQSLLLSFPDNKPANQALGVIYFQKNQYIKAEEHYSSLYEKFFGELLWVKLEHALFKERLGLFEDALNKLLPLYSEESDDFQLAMVVSRCLIKLKEHEKAQVILDSLIEKNPFNEYCYFALAKLKRELGDLEGASDVLERFFTINSELPNIYFEKITDCLYCHNILEAKSLIKKVKVISSDIIRINCFEEQVNNALLWEREKTIRRDKKGFSALNETYMTVLKSSHSIDEVKAIYSICKANLSNESWFAHHYAKWLNAHGFHQTALNIWCDLSKKDAQRHYYIGAMTAASLLSDFNLVRSLCIDYAEHFPVNYKVDSFFKKAGLSSAAIVTSLQLNCMSAEEYLKSKKKMIYVVLHSGDIGDLIYAMPTFKKLGRVSVYITTTSDTREGLTKRLPLIAPLLLAQDYIESVDIWSGEDIDFDMSHFRMNSQLSENTLVESQANFLFGKDFVDIDEPWLKVDGANKHERAVFSRSMRYRSESWNKLWAVFKELYPNAIFVGIEAEFKEFAAGEFMATSDFYEVAKIIAGSSLFIGNQSAPFSIAEGLKVKRILEASSFASNCSGYAQAVSVF